jgi:hypothetical protein
MILLAIYGGWMTRFIAGTDRGQSTLLPECLDDWIDESNAVRVIDAFVDALDLAALELDGVIPAATGRPPPDVAPDLWLVFVMQKDSLRRAVQVLVLSGTQRPQERRKSDDSHKDR